MTKAKVVLNEQHQLLASQEAILNDCFGKRGWEIFPIPAKGLTLPEMEEAIKKLLLKDGCGKIVFASPVPVMLMKLSALSALSASESEKIDVMVFHNDSREKKEVGNGKIIFVVAETGWELVKAL